MSQFGLPPNAVLITVSNGADDRLISMPAFENAVFRTCISWSTTTWPDAYWRLKLALAPALTPSPHWPGPVPGLVHVLTPPWLTAQPLSLSSFAASSEERRVGTGVLYWDID